MNLFKNILSKFYFTNKKANKNLQEQREREALELEQR
jgi:hypothetical protein